MAGDQPGNQPTHNEPGTRGSDKGGRGAQEGKAAKTTIGGRPGEGDAAPDGAGEHDRFKRAGTAGRGSEETGSSGATGNASRDQVQGSADATAEHEKRGTPQDQGGLGLEKPMD